MWIEPKHPFQGSTAAIRTLWGERPIGEILQMERASTRIHSTQVAKTMPNLHVAETKRFPQSNWCTEL